MIDSADPTKRILNAQSRSVAYGFLAWLFLDNPDRAFIDAMMTQEEMLRAGVLDDGEEISPAILSGLRQIRSDIAKYSESSIDDLCIELGIQRTRLLRGIDPGYGPPPPYEAVYRCPGDCQESELMLRITAFYQEAGAQLPYGQRERLDYLGCELDLMRFMCAEEVERREDGDIDAAEKMRQLQYSFLKEHLLVWVPTFCSVAQQDPRVEFYHGVVTMMGAYLQEDASAFLSPRQLS